MVIYDCGELTSADDWNFCDNDETDDKLAPFPEDWDQRDNEYTVNRPQPARAEDIIDLTALLTFFNSTDT